MTICTVLIAHLLERQETRWHTFGEYLDYPECDSNGLCFINSKMVDGTVTMIRRPLVGREDSYEHSY